MGAVMLAWLMEPTEHERSRNLWFLGLCGVEVLVCLAVVAWLFVLVVRFLKHRGP